MDKVETKSTPIAGDVHVSKTQVASMKEDFKSLIKVGIINSNLITVFTGFWLALHLSGTSFKANWDVFILTMLGSALVIAGGCILNNWYDVDIDPVMERTKSRPTVTGHISLQVTLLLGCVTTAVGLLLLLGTTVTATLIALFGWFSYVVLYTIWSKRRYTLNTAIGSLSGAVPPLIGWAAIEPRLDAVAIVLFLIMFIWQTPHFLALAMKKNEDYKAAGIPMLPAVYGFQFTKRQIFVYVACLLPLPFYLTTLGHGFLTIATVLNITWLILALTGFFMKDSLKWANLNFVYSLNYLIIMFVTMIIVTI